MIIHEMEQRTPEWYLVRFGKITGSDFFKFMGAGKMAEDKIFEKVAERITGQSAVEAFVSVDTERGKTLEDMAIFLYEVTTNNIVRQVGFVERDDLSGCSPDGLVGDDGMIEVKCPRPAGHIKTVIKSYIKPEYMIQIQYNLFICERKWCDFVSYCQAFGDPHVIRVYRDEELITKIKQALDKAESQIRLITAQMGALDETNHH